MGVAFTSLCYQGNDNGRISSAAIAILDGESKSSSSSSALSSSIVAPATTVADGLTTSTTTKVVTTKDFKEIGFQTGTDKVAGEIHLEDCLQTGNCGAKECERKECRPYGHWYQTMYQQWISKYALPTTEPFQFLEIGYFTGKGYETYDKFFSDAPKAELHSMEISCMEEGPRDEGKWPKEWGNFAKKAPRYQSLLDAERLHCGDASNVEWLNEIWTTKMHRPDAPPLRIVVDDASHLAEHMVTSVFFWFPRIEPGGLLIVEDIQPTNDANHFRTNFLPQVRINTVFLRSILCPSCNLLWFLW
jgi:hypothetical protein